VVRKFGTKDMTKISGGIGALPWSGPMLVAAVLALSAMPPFGIFRSEFLIVSGGLSDPRDTVAAVLVVLMTLAFFGLSWFTTQTMLTPDPAIMEATAGGGVATLVKGEVSSWIVVSMVLGLAALLILGVHPPAQLSQLLTHAARELGSPR
jgi:hydrogenase-4 component F